MTKAKTLSIIGAGRAGKTLGRLFDDSGVFSIYDVVDTDKDRTADGVAFIGGGRPLEKISAMKKVDVYMITVRDREIIDCSRELADTGIIGTGSVVFHCGGSLPSSVMKGIGYCGASMASIHPVKSFADPGKSVETFNGTFCGAEGNGKALDILLPAFESIGGRIFKIDPDKKAVFHAAAVTVCNYLPVLLEMGFVLCEKAGIPRSRSEEILAPIVRETIDNIFESGTAKALTGPVVRGDIDTINRHLEIIKEVDDDYTELYRLLTTLTKKISDSH